MEKRNYWLKLKEFFFKEPRVKKLRKIAGGDTYTIIYLEILLLTIRTNGYLVFQGIEKTLAEELALILDEDVDNITVTLEFMKSNNLIEKTENENEYFLPEMLTLIGSESESAKWVRDYRERKRQNLLSAANPDNGNNNKTLQCKANVMKCKENVIIDIDIDKDIDKDKEKEYKEKERPPIPPLRGESFLSYPQELEVLNYLNQKTNKNFSSKNKNNLKNITARLKEGFTVEQMKSVVDKKTAEWLNDKKMNEFLNPETLFRPSKFEKYLNQKILTPPVNSINDVFYENADRVINADTGEEIKPASGKPPP
jgi:predicted phage replisome organizer/uncharacterized phage protein (TIGR02220 family)